MVHELKSKIESYVNSSKSRSLCRLAKDSCVPYSTIRRITQGEVTTVNQEISVAILRVIDEPENVMLFIEKHYPESGKAFRDFTRNLHSFVDNETRDFMSDPNYWFCICMAEKKCGVTRDELVYHLGESLIDDITSRLLAEDIFYENEGRYYLKNRDFSTSGDADTLLRIIRHVTRFYDSKRRSMPGHMLANLTTGWNEAGLSLVRETLKDAAIKLSNASKNPEYMGNMTCAFGIVASVLDRRQ